MDFLSALAETVQWIQQHKWWLAACFPIVIIFIVLKLRG